MWSTTTGLTLSCRQWLFFFFGMGLLVAGVGLVVGDVSSEAPWDIMCPFSLVGIQRKYRSL
jgi:hypothetical protein